MKKRCGKCAFWHELDIDTNKNTFKDAVEGTCNRYPPVLDLTWLKEFERENRPDEAGYSYIDYRHWNHPVTTAYNVCGEFK